ncbi:MAG: RICIN domain-containing protein [Bacteroidales bacterium]|nr:RICIN domain-containing protein [Bacteroidales bacterium]
MRTLRFLPKLLAAILFLSLINSDISAQSGIYVGGHFRRERTHTVSDLKASGFRYVILFNINVEANGDLTTDGETICTNGAYVFGNTQPNYINDVNSLKTGATSVSRVEQCIGGWGNHSYTNIKNLVASQGTGTGSILYRNFSALKNAIPSIDAINNDDEEAYDVNSATAFHIMLADIGFKTTLAPYMNKSYWQSLATNINNQRAGAVDRIYLQCYDGGAGNNPCDWNINNITMHTGGLSYEDQNNVIAKMTSARNNCNSKGGFFWVYNDNNINLQALASSVNNLFGAAPKYLNEACNFFKDIDYKLFSNGLEAGDYNLSALQAKGISDNDISSLTIAEGFEVVAYDGANFDGSSKTFTGNISWIGSDWNDKISSLKIRSAGATNLSGIYYLQNRKSNLYMDVNGGTSSLDDGANIQQYSFTGATNQQFSFEHLGNGTYKISAVHSGKVIDVAGISKENWANIHQWAYYGTQNQQFIAVPTDNGYYKLIAKHSGKIVEVVNASNDAGANVQQYANNSHLCGQWKPVAVSNNGNGDGLMAYYYNGLNFETPVGTRVDPTINFNWGTGSPMSGVNNDVYSVRWRGQIQPRYSDTYTFYITSDNGRRVWVNNQLIIDKWVDDWDITYTGSISLVAGQKYDIKVEYFENNGGANCKLEWSSSSQAREVVPQSQLYSAVAAGDGLTGQYYNGMDFQTYVSSRVDPTINFDWGSGSPVSGVNADAYSVRWTGLVAPKYTQAYTFYLNTDNGRRLWVNNQLIIDAWADNWGVEYTGTINLVAGFKYDIKLEYFENWGGAACKMEWSSASQGRQVIPQSQLYSSGTMKTTSENITGKSEGHGYKLYPNPASNIVYINGLQEQVQISVFNAFGQKIADHFGTELNIEELPIGIYILHFIKEGQNYSFRFIKK